MKSSEKNNEYSCSSLLKGQRGWCSDLYNKRQDWGQEKKRSVCSNLYYSTQKTGIKAYALCKIITLVCRSFSSLNMVTKYAFPDNMRKAMSFLNFNIIKFFRIIVQDRAQYSLLGLCKFR